MSNNEIVHSKSVTEAIGNFALAIPPALIKALATKILNFSNSYFHALLSNVMKFNVNAKDFEHEVDKSKKYSKILILIITESLKDPAVQRLFSEMLEQFKVVLNKFQEVLEKALPQYEQLLLEEGNKIEKAAYKVSRQTVQSGIDGALDAASAIPPPIGTIILAAREAGDIITPIQQLTQKSLAVFLSSANAFLDLYQSVEGETFDGLQAAIKTAQTGINITKTLTDKIDAATMLIEGIQEGGGYVDSSEVPWPDFTPPPAESYKNALKPNGGVTMSPQIKKALNKVRGLAKQAQAAKQQFNNTKKTVDSVRNIAKNPKNFIKKAKNNVKQQVKKEVQKTKNDIKKSTKNIALKGGRKSRRKYKRKSKRNTKKNRN